MTGCRRPADSDSYGLDPALAGIIVRKAHAAGLRVSAHVESAFDFEVAVKAGADIIAHLPGFWPDERRIASKGLDLYKISEPAARNAGRRGVKVITTIGESLRLVETDPKWSARRGALLDVYRHNIGLLSKHGVRLAIGSDQFRGTSVQEAIDIEKAGLMDRAELLRALSVDGAATVFPKRGPYGLMEGARADFLVLDVDPLQDFTAITRIGMRVKSGVSLPPPAR